MGGVVGVGGVEVEVEVGGDIHAISLRVK
jgi:hypothetical protein